MIAVNTKNILFICGGAFDGIEPLIKRRVKSNAIGFSVAQEGSVDSENILELINPTDLKAYGLIPELIGRFPVLTYLDPLDADSLRRILTEPKNALVKQYVKLFSMDKVKLSFEKEVLEFIVEKAVEFKLGARGLRSICEAILNDAMFELPGDDKIKELKVTGEYARDKFNKSKLSKLRVA